MKKHIAHLLTKQGLAIAVLTAAALGAGAAALISSTAQADTQPAAMKYESTDEYREWLNKINELCKQQHNPAEDREGFWNCLEEETTRDPPPANHLK